MYIKDFVQLKEYAGKYKKKVVVAAAHDMHTLEAVLSAHEEGILDYHLIGKQEEIKQIGERLGYKIEKEKISECSDDKEAARLSVNMIKKNEADFIQKGLLQTSDLLKAVVNKEDGIGNGTPISHVALLEIPKYHKVVGVTDGGMILYPDLETKAAIIKNAVNMFERFGYQNTMVAAVCPVETVNPKMQETIDAQKLKEMSVRGELGNCYVEGPISFDLAVNKESAQIKRYESAVTGETDIFLVPNISVGNIMVKSLLEFAEAQMAGCVVGAKCPIALNSRSASFEEKYYSLMLCAYLAGMEAVR